jgi:protein SCO1/2
MNFCYTLVQILRFINTPPRFIQGMSVRKCMKREKAFNLRILLLMSCLLTLFLSGPTQTCQAGILDAQKAPGEEPTKGKVARITDKGLFSVSIVIEGRELLKGANSVGIVINDKQSRPVDGAEITAIPWLPVDKHGVSDKPVVKRLGEGKYLMDNLVLDRNGIWDLKVSVRSGAQEDRTVFQFPVGMGILGRQEGLDRRDRKSPRTVEYYKIPDVTLLNQDGEKKTMKSLVDADRPLIIDFIYTTCTTVCPVLSAGFAGIQNRLGKDANKVQLVSMSIDPENDKPEARKKYLAKYHAVDGWDFLTGSYNDVLNLLKIFSCDSDKQNHQPLYLIHAPKSETWVRIEGLVSASDLMEELRKLEKK